MMVTGVRHDERSWGSGADRSPLPRHRTPDDPAEAEEHGDLERRRESILYWQFPLPGAFNSSHRMPTTGKIPGMRSGPVASTEAQKPDEPAEAWKPDEPRSRHENLSNPPRHGNPTNRLRPPSQVALAQTPGPDIASKTKTTKTSWNFPLVSRHSTQLRVTMVCAMTSRLVT